MLNIKTYQDFAKFLEKKLNPQGAVFAVGVTAFMRFFPALFLQNFKIITFKDSKDNKVLEKYAEIFCLKKTRPTIKLKFSNANNLLRNKTIRNYISSFRGNKILFLYRSNNNIQNAVKDLGVKIIANKSRINKIFENKANFRKVMAKVRIKPIVGKTFEFEEFKSKNYKFFRKKYGPKFVIQLPDFMLGGGKGTLFINKEKDFKKLKMQIKEGKFHGKALTVVNVTKFIEGLSCSVVCCATKYGTLVSKIQRQIIDIPQIISPKKGNGLFCGHVFGPEFSPQIVKQSQEIAQKLGKYMYKSGYEGIFGIDLIVNKRENKVYPVECNARYTGAFPMLSMIHLKYKIIPMDLFHFLEFLNIPYKINVVQLNKMYQSPISGSHIILSNTNGHSSKVKKELEVGVYNFNPKNKKFVFKKEAIFYDDLENDNDFILVDGVPKKGTEIKKWSRLARICHVLFLGNILQSNGHLKDKNLKIVRSIYKKLFK
jgi:formate-dependent phosphoribosylglycinamide formyltransferase (GAR transformylase)